jgi:hypothetical protein
MEDISINHLAVIAAAISTFLLGGLWYSPILFGKSWQQESHLSDEQIKNSNKGRIFGLAFLFSLVMSYNLAFFLGDPSIDLWMGTLYGFLTGFGWVAMGIFIVGMFELKSWRYLWINGGYFMVAFTIMGAILGVWK